MPYVGSLIAAALPVALAAAVDPTGWSTALWTLGLFVVAEGVTGQVVEPLVYGHSTGLSPFAVVVAALFWTWLWGPVGLLLSTPFTVCLVVLGRHVERLEFLDVLLGDRPALSPAEGFYQRMLAGDPDEALDQAELLLKDRPLSSYYDEVALKGLQLAARDAQRGLLPPDQVERVRATVRSLIDDLADRGSADARPEPSDAGPGGPTLAEKAVPGREPLPGRAAAGAGSRRPGAARRRCCAWPAAARSTRRPRPCWPSSCSGTGWARGCCRTRRPRAGASSGSTWPGSRWSASPTSTSPAARRTCATCCSGSSAACPARRCWWACGRPRRRC